MLLIPLLLLPNFLFLIPLSAPAAAASASQDASDTPLPPGTVTNLAGKTSPQPSCSPSKTTERLAPTSNWSATINVPSSLFGGKPVGANTTETFALAEDGTLVAADGSGNSFALAPLAGLPSGNRSVSMMANSTTALQTFTVTSGSTIIASATVSYSVITSFCFPAGLRMEISGDVAWKGNSGTVSIPFRSQPTFDHIMRTKDNASAPYDPTRATFGHGKDAALAFDWSDSKKLGPAYNGATNSVDYQVGDAFLIDPVVTAAHSHTNLATKADYQSHACYASGRYWVFFDDGYERGYVTSPDLVTWSSEITFGASTFSVASYCSGNTLYYAYTGPEPFYYSFDQIFVFSATLNPDGTMTQLAQSGFYAYGINLRGISLTLDSAGGLWVAFGDDAGLVEVWHCPNPSACSWTDSKNIPTNGVFSPYADIVPLTGGKVAVAWTDGYNTMGSLGIATFSGAAWSLPAYANGLYRIDASTCVSIKDTAGCGVDSGDTAVGFVSAAYNGNSPAWSGFKRLAACSSTTDCYASLSTGGSGSLALTFAKSSSTVGFSQSFDAGAYWSFESDFSTSETNPAYVSSPFYLGDRIVAAWTDGCSSFFDCALGPYDVRFAEALTTPPASPTPPWGQPGLSPYGSYVNNAQVYVSMGNGLLSVEQPTFTLPGRGLSVSPDLVYQEPGSFGLFDRPFQTDNFTLSNLGLGWSLNLPWLGKYDVHLPDGQEYPYSWSGVDMQVHGPVDFELTAASVTGSSFDCPCALVMPSGVEFNFNAAKQLVTESDPTGLNTISFGYGVNGLLSTITDTVGRTTAFSYNSNNQLIGIIAPGGRIWSLGYSGDKLTAETDPIGRITGFRYNSTLGSGWLVDEVDYPMLGAKVTLAYGIGVVSSGAAYVVTSRNVYSAAGAISQSNYMSYILSNGTLLVSSLGEAGGDGLLQGVVTKVFQSSKGMETTYYRDQALNVFRTTEVDYAANRVTATKIEGSSGNVLAETDMRYDGWGNVVYTKDNVGQQTWMAYASMGLPGQFGNLACGSFGFYSNPVPPTIHDRLLGTCDWQDQQGTVQQETFYRYDGLGELTETRASHNGGWLYTDYAYDAYGNVASVKDADGNLVFYTYSPAYNGAYLTRESRAVGSGVIATQYGYDFNAGFMTSTTDPNGQTTSYAYDAVGRALTVTYPAVSGISSIVSYSYDDTNGVVTAVDSNLNVVKAYFDGLGRETQLQVLDDKGKVYSNTYYAYNWMDKASQVTLPSGSVYSYTYDSVGRPLSQTNPDGSRSTVYYNDNANTVVTKDPDGKEVAMSYDWNGRLEATLQFATATMPVGTSHTYDLAGNLLSTTNGDGQVTTFRYDDLDRLTQVVNPDGNSMEYAYDGVGNLVSKTTPNEATIGYAYDSASRLVGITYPGGTLTSYTYDQDGNVLSVSSTLSGATQDAFSYDAMGRLTSTTMSVAGGSYTTSYGYDQAGNLVSVTYPDGLVVPMSYDFENRLTAVGSRGSVASFSYNLDGTIAQVGFGDREVQSYTYDSRDRVTSILDAYHKTAPMNLTYTYDAAGNVVGINSEAFAYDGMNRLVSATGGWGTTTYAYDGAGDMLASTTGGTTTGYAGCGYYANSATANTWMTCSTDKNGNIVSKSGGWTYSYDYEDEMVSAALNGVARQTNVYDGLGNRVETSGTGSTVFTYQGVDLLFERNLTAWTATDHVYGDGMQLAKVVGGTTTYFHEDRLGSNRAETSAAKGKVTTQFSSDYQPYGQNYGATGSEPFQFADRMVDSSTGLYYFNARFYDPSIMRFMQKDPGGSDASPYMYADDNPLGYSDPTGLQAMDSFCPVVCQQAPQTYAHAYDWYREYQLSELAIDQACSPPYSSGCGQLAFGYAGGAVVGDVIIEGAEAAVSAAAFEEAGAGLGRSLAVGPEIKTVRLLLNPTSEEFATWLESARAATPEDRGDLVHGFFMKLFREANYNANREGAYDIFARGRLRSLFVEIKSKLEGGWFGSQKDIDQLEGYLVASQRRGASRWLGVMGINNPIELSAPLRAYMNAGNVGLIEVRWVAPGDTLLPYL
ncbi:MAG: RHS repeat protein [Thaumarchaeota archaeon]|nr:RHS repeat protein [Nitrososphaerota archaeon]